MFDTHALRGYAKPISPHWESGFGRPLKNRRKSYASNRSRGFFYASRFMVGGVLGGSSQPAGFCSPVDQPDMSPIARGLVASDGGFNTVIGEQTMNIQNASIAIANITIRQDDQGRYCLNDLHCASGSDNKHRPSLWLNNQQAQELIAEIEKDEAGITASKILRGRGIQGTYVVRELVYAYAMWISAKFHLQVIRAYDAQQGNPEQLKRLTHEVDFLQREHERLSKLVANSLTADLTTFETSGIEKVTLQFKAKGFSFGRWVVTLSDGLFTIKPIAQDEFTTTSESLARIVGDSMGGAVKRQHLAEIIEAAAKRMK
jgi:hypothetical protein